MCINHIPALNSQNFWDVLPHACKVISVFYCPSPRCLTYLVKRLCIQSKQTHIKTPIAYCHTACRTDASHNIKKWLRGTAKVSLVSIVLHKAPNPNLQPAKSFRSRLAPGSGDISWCQGGHTVSFQYVGHDLLVSGNDLVFRRLHTYGYFSLFTECLIRFYKFQSSCFRDHK